MNRLYTIMLLVLVLVTANAHGETLDDHPLGEYTNAEDYAIHQYIVSGHNYRSLRGAYFHQNCIIAEGCEVGMDDYERALNLYKREGRLPDGWRLIHLENYYRQCIPEGVEEMCTYTVNLAVGNLKKLGRTDITEAHLRNPAFWGLQEKVTSAYDEKERQFKREIAAKEEARMALCYKPPGHTWSQCPDKSYPASDPRGVPETVAAYEAASASVKAVKEAAAAFYREVELRLERFSQGSR